jgi:hypothetical protein
MALGVVKYLVAWKHVFAPPESMVETPVFDVVVLIILYRARRWRWRGRERHSVKRRGAKVSISIENREL